MPEYVVVAEGVPFERLRWVIGLQLVAVLMVSSLFMAMGAAVMKLKEAQCLLLHVWMVIVMPMFVWIIIVRDPNGGLATWLSLFPPFIPMLMCLRMSCTSTIPIWQPVLGLLFMLGTTGVCVFAASRVFRIGMLTSGRAPKIGELIRWAIRG